MIPLSAVLGVPGPRLPGTPNFRLNQDAELVRALSHPSHGKPPQGLYKIKYQRRTPILIPLPIANASGFAHANPL
jgi:hypothetical protein